MEEMIELARRVSQRAYAPYSKFYVGAVVVTPSGEAFAGCNVENASYGLTICAERNAVFQMVAAGFHVIERVFIYTPTPSATGPCGACRQVLYEFGPNAMIHSIYDGGQSWVKSLGELLPFAFGPHNLT